MRRPAPETVRGVSCCRLWSATRQREQARVPRAVSDRVPCLSTRRPVRRRWRNPERGCRAPVAPRPGNGAGRLMLQTVVCNPAKGAGTGSPRLSTRRPGRRRWRNPERGCRVPVAPRPGNGAGRSCFDAHGCTLDDLVRGCC
ncbi:hypothetical protein DVU_1872 [Nitratidesulfovibrio vulgaris str. Hildenborough]|uniref:Uncharacterized protein n=1 Tax=Nitratidesulfovibrio vulgaris (strain ATCC 29579 / DSM 644 / CCUG 34227 / NCIMB 8303 / VKM B-1760 / Hildenborough) TaxID=882 RepID=Q72AW8_NITV2|nr:hypothetical protein DVU_1872 [Nitratidesulfovibrio vulgaris str. Hildenborough]